MMIAVVLLLVAALGAVMTVAAHEDEAVADERQIDGHAPGHRRRRDRPESNPRRATPTLLQTATTFSNGDTTNLTAWPGPTHLGVRDDTSRCTRSDICAWLPTAGARAVLHPGDMASGRKGPVRREPATGPLDDRLAQLMRMHEAALATNAAECLTEAAPTVTAQFCVHSGSAVGRLCLPPPAPGVAPPSPVWHITKRR